MSNQLSAVRECALSSYLGADWDKVSFINGDDRVLDDVTQDGSGYSVKLTQSQIENPHIKGVDLVGAQGRQVFRF